MRIDKSHLLHYSLILGIVLLGFAGMTAFNGQKSFQIAMLFTTALVYIAYGILHHYFEHDVTPKIVVEYVLVGMLGFLLFLFVVSGT